MNKKQLLCLKRHKRVRQKVVGTSQRPRLSIYRSLKGLYAQIIDDTKSHTLLSVSTQQKDIRKLINFGGNTKAASILGEYFAKKAIEKGIKKVAFDRGCYQYHGRVKAFAEAARKAGLEF